MSPLPLTPDPVRRYGRPECCQMGQNQVAKLVLRPDLLHGLE